MQTCSPTSQQFVEVVAAGAGAGAGAGSGVADSGAVAVADTGAVPPRHVLAWT